MGFTREHIGAPVTLVYGNTVHRGVITGLGSNGRTAMVDSDGGGSGLWIVGVQNVDWAFGRVDTNQIRAMRAARRLLGPLDWKLSAEFSVS